MEPVTAPTAARGAALVARAALVAAIAAVAVAPAHGQSRRYPAPVVDPDDAAEHASGFWAGVADPVLARYDGLVKDALLTVRGDRRRAIELLREAAALRPERVDAWGYLGLVTDQVRDFPGCAEGYGRAAAIAPRWRPDPTVAPARGIGAALASGRPLTIAHAICRSRAGDVAGAIAALEAVVARGEAMPELWLRLGEAYLAAGRVDDAASALAEAIAVASGRDAEALWLLAVAHDRARRTSLAEAAARDAQRFDGGAVNATSTNRPPPIAPGDREYLLGVAALTPPVREPPEPIKPEWALIYFRRYLAVAPATSPWRARAAEHVAAVAALDLAARLTITGGGFGDRAAVERAVRARLPALRACLAATPTTLIELRVTALGPTGGPPPRPARVPTVRPPASGRGPTVTVRPIRVGAGRDDRPPDGEAPGVSAHPVISFERPTGDTVEEAAACVEKAAASLVLPRPPAGSWATVRIPIASP